MSKKHYLPPAAIDNHKTSIVADLLYIRDYPSSIQINESTFACLIENLDLDLCSAII